MPHVGKDWPRAAFRDFSKPYPTFQEQMPVGLIASFSGCVGIPWVALNGQSFASGRGVADYDRGVVEYLFDVASIVIPFETLLLTWHLTFDEPFGYWSWEFFQFGSPHVSDTPDPADLTSRCAHANWRPPLVKHVGGGLQIIGSSSNVRPMTWAEATAATIVPRYLRF